MKKFYIIETILIIMGTILYFLANLQRVAVPGAIFDTLQASLSANVVEVTALGAAFMYVYAIGQLIAGVLITRYGGFRVITIGAAIFAIGCLMFPFVKVLNLLYISRALVGLGASTFYLGLIQETKRMVHKSNFGLVLSFILSTGYIGGILANAPLVFCVEKIGWHLTFIIIAIFTIFITMIFVVLKNFATKEPKDRTVKFNFELYKHVLVNKNNLNLYTFAALNYGIYFLLQTVIGKKFLEDFVEMPLFIAAFVLTLMGTLYAIAGPIMATISKMLLNRRTIFIKFSALNSFLGIIFIGVCLLIDLKTPIIAFFFSTMAFFASLSPILVPLLHDLNDKKDVNVAVSMMTSSFFVIAAILSNFTGFVLGLFPYEIGENGVLIYSNMGYFALFLILFFLSLISLYCAFRIKESKSTVRYIHIHNLH